MPVTETLMGPGSLTLDLLAEGAGRGSTPSDLLDQITPYSAIVVTSAWQGPAGTISGADLLANARWSGIVRDIGLERTHLEGAGGSVLLGDEQGHGVCYIVAPFTVTKKLSDLIADNVLGDDGGGQLRGNGVTVGSIANPAGTKPVRINPGDVPLTVLNFACDVYGSGYEWRVNPDFTLDVDTKANLFPTATAPAAICVPGAGGRDLGVVGFRCDVDVHRSWDGYVTEVIVLDTIGGYSGASSASPYYAPDGNPIDIRRYVEAQNAANAAQGTSIGTRQLARLGGAVNEITVTAAHDVRDEVAPGDTIWVYSPADGLYDLAHEVHYRGQAVHPTQIRVMACTWPVTSGMGVYCRCSDSSNTVVDLTPYVAWEDASQGMELEVGSTRRTLVAA